MVLRYSGLFLTVYRYTGMNVKPLESLLRAHDGHDALKAWGLPTEEAVKIGLDNDLRYNVFLNNYIYIYI